MKGERLVSRKTQLLTSERLKLDLERLIRGKKERLLYRFRKTWLQDKRKIKSWAERLNFMSERLILGSERLNCLSERLNSGLKDSNSGQKDSNWVQKDSFFWSERLNLGSERLNCLSERLIKGHEKDSNGFRKTHSRDGGKTIIGDHERLSYSGSFERLSLGTSIVPGLLRGRVSNQ